MNLAHTNVPSDADPATIWAVNREFDLRWRRWRIYRIGAFGAMAEGVTAAMRRLSTVLTGNG